MEKKFTDEEILKALEQADANLDFEDIDLKEIINENSNQKTLKKEKKNE